LPQKNGDPVSCDGAMAPPAAGLKTFVAFKNAAALFGAKK